MWREVEPRLGNAEWKEYRPPAAFVSKCGEVKGRARALDLLPTAAGDCLNAVVAVIERHAPEDLAAAYYVRAERNGDPVDFLRALDASEASPFNRALAEQKLGLIDKAIVSFDAVREPQWSDEAHARRDALMRLKPPVWRPARLRDALRRGDQAAVTQIVREFPFNAHRFFEEETDLLDPRTSGMLAEAFLTRDDRFARDVADAVAKTRDRQALEEGIVAYRRGLALNRDLKLEEARAAFQQAASLLEQAGNPLYLSALYGIAACDFTTHPPLDLLSRIAPLAMRPGYRDLATRIHTLHASSLGYDDQYLNAHDAYGPALELAQGDSTATAAALSRRSWNYAKLGDAKAAFRDAFDALAAIADVADVNARHHAYGAAAEAARLLGYPRIALRYQNEAVDYVQKAVAAASAAQLQKAKLHLFIALRTRANIHVELGNDAAAAADVQGAADLAAALGQDAYHDLMKMRLQEVHGQALLKTNPAEAVRRFDEAITLAEEQDSTYRAVLYFKRAAAKRKLDDPAADEDIAKALDILRKEAVLLVDRDTRGRYEELWTPYFSRFQSMYHEMIESRIAENDIAGAFLYAEQARAFEPLQLLLQSKRVPRGFRKIETKADLQRELAQLPAGTHILQYVVLPERTYTWVLSRGRIDLVSQRVSRREIERWVNEAGAAEVSRQNDFFRKAMRAAYNSLFRTPLARVPASPETRIVIIPDGPMHGLPFGGLEGVKDGFLIERGSVAAAGSTSLYLYALARDREFKMDPNPPVLIIGDPRFDPRLDQKPLPYARNEAEQLGRDYERATVLLDREATVRRFLDAVKGAAIVHFAGHGVANPQSPWQSKLLLAAEGNDTGELTAEELTSAASVLERTRLVVLGACSTAGGQPIGPEGLAPLVRPLIAANVPAIVGTMRDVDDATAASLLVSFHCHYRHGDDVAVALRYAQLEMPRKNARLWAPFQVIGYARSPYVRPATLEELHRDNVCAQNSLHRPDGLHSQ